MPAPKLGFSIQHAGTWAALVLSVAALSSCGGRSSDPETGSLSVNLTDAPVDGAANTKSIDLLKLQNGVTGVLTQGAAVPAGDYDWMRLKVLARGTCECRPSL